jgi:hypothetical protein
VTVPDPELVLLERIKVVCDVEVEVEVALDVDMCLASLKLPYELALSELCDDTVRTMPIRGAHVEARPSVLGIYGFLGVGLPISKLLLEDDRRMCITEGCVTFDFVLSLVSVEPLPSSSAPFRS